MTEQQELIKLIIDDKKKANTYDRYPIRFLFMRLSSTAEADISNLISELVKLSKILEVWELSLKKILVKLCVK